MTVKLFFTWNSIFRNFFTVLHNEIELGLRLRSQQLFLIGSYFVKVLV